MILAGVLKSPGLILTEAEAHQLAEATANVSRHYNVQATQKTLDWINFCTCVTLIYGTRVMAASKRKKEEAEANPKPGKVIFGSFPGGPPVAEAPPFAGDAG